MAIYTFLEIATHARKNSKFYAEHFKDVPENEPDISAYPIIDQTKYWGEINDALTGVLNAGIIFKSGGTTGNPKFSYFTNEEWGEFTRISAKGYSQNGIKACDRVANLFYAGELYASFLYISFTSFFANVGINYPISGASSIEEIIKLIKSLNINVLAGVPTTIMKVVEYIEANKTEGINIDLILFGGESFYKDQRSAIKKVFPNVKINSILYASVDGGELGYSDSTCGIDEHRIFSETTIFEIIDEESGEVITEINKPGKVVITNLCRKFMPIIRYPAGDRAVWVEPEGAPNRKFRLMGRTEEGARIGPCTLYVQDALKIIEKFSDAFQVLNFQIIIEHFNNKDEATIHILPLRIPQSPDLIEEKIRNEIYEERRMLAESVKKNLIHPLKVKFINDAELITNPRTGKCKKVIDNRFK